MLLSNFLVPFTYLSAIGCGATSQVGTPPDPRVEVISAAVVDEAKFLAKHKGHFVLENTLCNRADLKARLVREKLSVGQPKPGATTINISKCDVKGSKATVDVSFDWGPKAGMGVSLQLVKSSGSWKVVKRETLYKA